MSGWNRGRKGGFYVRLVALHFFWTRNRNHGRGHGGGFGHEFRYIRRRLVQARG